MSIRALLLSAVAAALCVGLSGPEGLSGRASSCADWIDRTIAEGRGTAGDAEPQIFLPGLLSTPDSIEHGATVTKDGKEIWFTRARGRWGETVEQQTIYFMRRLADGSYGSPEPAPFSGRYLDDDPFPSPDGRWVYFVSDRPAPEASGEGQDLWRVRRSPEGWGEPEHLAVSSPQYDSSPVLTEDGTLWFSSTRPGSVGSGDLWRAAPDGKGGFRPPENPGSPLNSSHGEWNLLIAADGSWIILEASGRQENLSPSGDLYLSVREPTGWSEPLNLFPLNSAGSDLLPRFGPDGRLLFASSRVSGGRQTDVYAVNLESVLAMRGRTPGDYCSEDFARVQRNSDGLMPKCCRNTDEK